MKRADSLIAPLIKNLGIEHAVRLDRIKKEWANIFEKPISLHTTPATLKDGDLLINVDSPAWLQQLNFYMESIREKLDVFGVKTIRFKIGRVLPEKNARKVTLKREKLTTGETAYIEETVSSIPDRELKDSIRKAIGKSITFKSG